MPDTWLEFDPPRYDTEVGESILEPPRVCSLPRPYLIEVETGRVWPRVPTPPAGTPFAIYWRHQFRYPQEYATARHDGFREYMEEGAIYESRDVLDLALHNNPDDSLLGIPRISNGLGGSTVEGGTLIMQRITWEHDRCLAIHLIGGIVPATAIDAVWNWNGYMTESTATTNVIWPMWVRAAATSPTYTLTSSTTTTPSTVVWLRWNQERDAWRAINHAPTEEQRQAETARQQQVQSRLATEKRKREEAEERAKTLLVAHLDPVQKQDFVERGEFFLHVGKKRYRIRKGWSGHVELVDEQGQALHRYCAHPNVRVPDYDNMLAAKLHLEANEAEFLKIANVHF